MSKKSAREKQSAFNAKMQEQNWDFYLEFSRNGKLIEKYLLPKRGDHAQAIAKFEKDHGSALYSTYESHVDKG
jgi:hypothetical protein